MSVTFTKLFSSITESTVWCEPDHVRLLWITMLAMSDRNGRVWGSVPGLANRARIPTEAARDGLQRFMSPDPDSRTPANEGRRIEPIDGGWRLLNHEKYRAIRDEESVKESKRNYINARRQKERESVNVDNVDRSRGNAEAYTEAEAEAVLQKQKQKHKASAQAPFELPDWIPQKEWDAWIESRAKKRNSPTNYAKELAVLKLKNLEKQGFAPAQVLMQSAFNGWTGLFPQKEIK